MVRTRLQRRDDAREINDTRVREHQVVDVDYFYVKLTAAQYSTTDLLEGTVDIPPLVQEALRNLPAETTTVALKGIWPQLDGGAVLEVEVTQYAPPGEEET